MNVEVIIPARLESKRFPRKLLYEIGGQPVLWWTWKAAKLAGYRVTIATDSALIQQAASRWGARVVLTGAAANGTERCAIAMRSPTFRDAEIVVNWQGDAPLIPSTWVNVLVHRLKGEPLCDLATVASLGDAAHGSVAVTVGPDGCAEEFERVEHGSHLLHHGLYAYRRHELARYAAWASTPAERHQSLEQLRWAGRASILVCEVNAPARPIPEVNNPADLELVAAELEARNAVA